ncbi:MAG: glycosyltransferase family 2 protein [Atribacterota bacterium]
MSKVSVLIPVFNRENYLKESVYSIINQTYKNLDILIYDDGSTDNSIKIAKELASGDNRIKLYKGKRNNGGAYAKKQLIKKSKTNIICYQDSDDISSPERIEYQLKEMEKGNDLVYCKAKYFKLKNENITFNQRYDHCYAAIMYKKDLQILPDESFKIAGGDIEFIKRYLNKHKKQITINKVLYYIRQHQDRIGVWKKRFRKIPKHIKNQLTYKELIEYYNKNYEK